MVSGGNVDNNGSEKKMEGGGLRTVECLRGRLLAERAASKVAKEDAEQMGNKLIDLENQVKEEITSRDKAERKLKFLKAKLKLLKIPYVLEDAEQSNLSEHSEITSNSSSISSGSQNPGEKEPESHVTKSAEHNFCTIKCNQSHESPSTEDVSSSSSNGSYVDFNSNEDDPSKSDGPKNSSKTDENHSSKSSIVDLAIDGEDNPDREDYIDNSLAIVPASFPAASLSPRSEAKKVSSRVRDVLAALQHAKEELQSSMDRTQRIKASFLTTQIC